MSLLTPSEAHAFQKFLTSLDTTDFSTSWNIQLEVSHEHMPPAHGREALAQATKDLMSLDAEKWRYPLGHQSPTPVSSSKRSPPPDHSVANKRRRQTSVASQQLASDAPHGQLNKPSTLLSPSQKKANHIQSEQKRRANIRKGYEALCEVVPPLREAMLAEAMEEDEGATSGKKGGRRRCKGKAGNEDGEKIDGRAGPKSEHVVLSKTIDYIAELLSEREVLQQRLMVARSALPLDHPWLQHHPDAPPPLWERKWTGGDGKAGDDEEDDEMEP